ncbi:unnamed protein product [Arabidopsis halleri]
MKNLFQLSLIILTFFIILELGVMGNVQQGKREQCHTNIPNKSGKCIYTECKSACKKLKKGPVCCPGSYHVASICLPPKTCRCYHFCS